MNQNKIAANPIVSDKQGQYLAFIYAYTIVLGRPPAEADLQRHFRVTPPSVHQMILTLERQGFYLAHTRCRANNAGAGRSRHATHPQACPRPNRQIPRAEPLASTGEK